MKRVFAVLWLLSGVAWAQGTADPDADEALGIDFADGFEAGLSNWTPVIEGSNVLHTDAAQVWDGQRALHAKWAGGNETRRAFVEKPLSGPGGGSLFLRAWVYLPSATVTGLGTGGRLRILEARGATDVLALELVGQDGGPPRLLPIVAGTQLASATPPVLTPDTWHRVEVGYDLAAQQAVLYLDDVRAPRVGLSLLVSLPPTTHLRAGLVQMTTGVTQAAVFLDNVALSSDREGTYRSVHQLSLEFDGPGLVTHDEPPGKAALRFVEGSLTLSSESAAAHHGTRGLQILDQDTTTAGQGAALLGYLSKGAETLYLRFWFREASVTAAGSYPLASLNTVDDGGVDQAGLLLSKISDTLSLTVNDDSGADSAYLSDPLISNEWHLVELVARGMRSSAGSVQAYLNGDRFADTTGRAWTQMDFDAWALGGIAGAPQFTGVVHLDEARLSRALQPNRFEFAPPLTFERGGCRPVTLEALSAESVRARVPVPVAVELLLKDGAEPGSGFYSDPGCLTVLGQATVPAGAHSVSLYVRLNDSGASQTLATAASDYLPAQMPVTIAEAGTLPAVTGLSVTPNPAGFGVVTVLWNPVGTVNFSHYSVTQYRAGVETASDTTGTAGYTFDPLPGDTLIAVRQHALDGTFSPEALISLTTDEAPPPTPGLPNVAWSSATDIATVSWDPVIDEQTSTLNYTLKISGPQNLVLEGLTSTAYELHVTASGTYSFSVLAVDVVGNASTYGPVRTVDLAPAASQPPVITTAPNTRGAVGVPYRISSSGLVEATSATPVSWSVCAGPSGFAIDADTGLVSWTPTAAGDAALCLTATNAVGPTNLNWTVQVSEPVPVEARLNLSSNTGTAPLTVTLDASDSETSGEVLVYRWSFGDGSRAQTQTPTVQHVYALPGRYNPSVTVVDALGGEDSDTETLRLDAADGRSPPEARILASQLTGVGEVDISFSCECSSDVTGWSWDLGDGAAYFGPTKTHRFGPGRYWVRLAVVNEQGLMATDEVEVVVTAADGAVPPRCAPSATPTSGASPLTATHAANASAMSSPVTTIQWSFGGEDASGEVVEHTYAQPGWHAATLRVLAADGLSCQGAIPIAVTSTPGQLPVVVLQSWAEGAAVCGQPFVHEPGAAVLPAERTWRLEGAPEGMVIDAHSGRVSWTPQPWQAGADGGVYQVQVIVEGSGASSRQLLNLAVTCGAAELTTPCGCGAGGGGPLLGAALLGLWRVLSRRRRRFTESG